MFRDPRGHRSEPCGLRLPRAKLRPENAVGSRPPRAVWPENVVQVRAPSPVAIGHQPDSRNSTPEYAATCSEELALGASSPSAGGRDSRPNV